MTMNAESSATVAAGSYDAEEVALILAENERLKGENEKLRTQNHELQGKLKRLTSGIESYAVTLIEFAMGGDLDLPLKRDDEETDEQSTYRMIKEQIAETGQVPHGFGL